MIQQERGKNLGKEKNSFKQFEKKRVNYWWGCDMAKSRSALSHLEGLGLHCLYFCRPLTAPPPRLHVNAPWFTVASILTCFSVHDILATISKLLIRSCGFVIWPHKFFFNNNINTFKWCMLLYGSRTVQIGHTQILSSCWKEKLQIQSDHRKHQWVCQANPEAEDKASCERKESCSCLKKHMN